MASLLSTLQFWSLREDIFITDGDIGCNRYHDKGDTADNQLYNEEKRSYCESRGYDWILSNKRPGKLRDSLKEIEHLYVSYRCILAEWRDQDILQMIFSNGAIAYIAIDSTSGDIEKIFIDKYLIGKLHSEHVVDAIVDDNFILFSYVEPKLSLIQITKAPSSNEGVKKWDKFASLNPKVTVVDLLGPIGRRLERKLSCNAANNLLMIWWRTSTNEAWPWTPLTTEKERANIHVYSMNGSKFELVCYYKTETEPLMAAFSKIHPHQILALEQKISHSSDYSAERCIYEVTMTKLQRVAVATIPLKSKVSCQCQNPQEDRVAIGCENGSLVMYDDYRQITQVTKTSFVPSVIAWHPGGAVFLVSNAKGQVSCYDQALSCVRICLLSEDPTTVHNIDTSIFFKSPANFQKIVWCCPASGTIAVPSRQPYYQRNADHALISFDGGPFGLLQFQLGVLSKGALSQSELISEYIKCRQIDEAVNLLSSLNWNVEAQLCYQCLCVLVNHLLRMTLNLEREAQLEAALGTFYAPVRPHTKVIILEYRDRLCNLARRFFHQLLRYQRLEKAYLLAVDLGSRDLFRDICYVAIEKGEHALAEVARRYVDELEDGSCADTDTEESQDYEDDEDNDEYSDDSYSSEYSDGAPTYAADAGGASQVTYPLPATRKFAQATIAKTTDFQTSSKPNSTSSPNWPQLRVPQQQQPTIANSAIARENSSIPPTFSQQYLGQDKSLAFCGVQQDPSQRGLGVNIAASTSVIEAHPRTYTELHETQQSYGLKLRSHQMAFLIGAEGEQTSFPIGHLPHQQVNSAATCSSPSAVAKNPSSAKQVQFAKHFPNQAVGQLAMSRPEMPTAAQLPRFSHPPVPQRRSPHTLSNQRTIGSSTGRQHYLPQGSNDQSVDADITPGTYLEEYVAETDEEEEEEEGTGTVKVVHFGIV